MRNLSFVLAATTALFAASAVSKTNTPTKNQLESPYIKAVASANVPGINVAVADKNGVVWAKGFGYADIENQVVMTEKHKMRIGSVAKLFATAAMMKMVEADKVNLDVPVTNYVEAWPNKHAPITLRQLAAHTSGVRHYRGQEFLMNKPFDSVTDSLDIFKQDALLFTPGSKQQYTTYGWSLVSAALEGAEGTGDFRTIMDKYVFSPLNMADSHFDDQYQLIPYRQRPYQVKDGNLENALQTDHSYKWAGGGFIATPSDVSRFLVANSSPGYLSKNTLTDMFTPATLSSGEKLGFGIGWVVNFDRYIKRSQRRQQTELVNMMNSFTDVGMHSGGSMGGVTMSILCKEHQRAVTVVKNVSNERSADVFSLALNTLYQFHKHD